MRILVLLMVWFFLLLFAILFSREIYAVTVTINSYTSSISSEIFNVEASVSGATNATNYLRVDLYKEGTNNYFGETYNGSDWYAGSDGKSYFPIQIQNSSASAIIQAQIGNPSINSYPGPGVYKLKLRRYTSSGSQSQNDQQTPVDVQLTYVFPTPSPTDTLTPVPTATATPTSTPTPTPTPSPSPTPTQTQTPTVKPTKTPTASVAAEILGASISATPSQEVVTPAVEVQTVEKDYPQTDTFTAIAVGITSIGLLGVIFYRLRKILIKKKVK